MTTPGSVARVLPDPLIDPMSLDPDGPAMHRQIADQIRELIVKKKLKDGDHLPSETMLAKQLSHAKQTIRQAYGHLEGEGYVYPRSSGKPTTVRAYPPSRAMSYERYQVELDRVFADDDQPPVAAFTTDHGIVWEQYTVDCASSKVAAGEAHARRLHVPKGSAIRRRVMTQYAMGRPASILISTMPEDMAGDSPIADPDNLPWPGGTIGELVELGIIVKGKTRSVEIEEGLEDRAPSTWEASQLGIPVSSYVWVNTRVYLVDGEPVEFSDVILPGKSGNRFHWRTSLAIPEE